MTTSEAYIAIMKRFRDSWSQTKFTLQNLDHKDVNDSESNLYEGDDPFVELIYDPDISFPAGIGTASPRRKTGDITLNIYTDQGAGEGDSFRLQDAFSSLFEGKTLDNIRFRNMVNHEPYRDGRWAVRPVQINFEHE